MNLTGARCQLAVHVEEVEGGATPPKRLGGESTCQGRGQGSGDEASGVSCNLEPSFKVVVDKNGDPREERVWTTGTWRRPASDMTHSWKWHSALKLLVMGLLKAHDVGLRLRPHASTRACRRQEWTPGKALILCHSQRLMALIRFSHRW